LGVAIGAAAWAMAVAGIGALFTELGPWYRDLKQPPWKPSDLWFGPAWTLIFTLTAIALGRAWWRADTDRRRWRIAAAGIVNGLLNIAWSALFFKAKRPDWALAEVVLLWLSILVMMIVCRREDRWATVLLLPYLVWVAFAGALNAAVVRLNGPFAPFGLFT
jgi:tryptophan-rich sensory protein